MSEPTDSLYSVTGDTHVGRRRHNEDCYLIDEELGLMIVADGVGGQNAGEVASRITCDVIAREIASGSPLMHAIAVANAEVAAAVGAGTGREGMASTVVAVLFDGCDYEIAWVGDSRGYLWDSRLLKLITRDHSFVEMLLESGKITYAEAMVHPQRNTIIQAIGLMNEHDLEIGVNRARLAPGEILVLCSDGLSDVVDSAEIAAILAGGDSLEVRCSRLVTTAVDAGGRDNITVLLAAAGEQALAADKKEPEVVWSFDPQTGEYTGLPSLEETPPIAGVAAPEPEMTRVTPRKPADSPAPNVADTTMMSSADIIAALERAEQQKTTRWAWPKMPRSKWLVSAAVALLAGLAWWILRK